METNKKQTAMQEMLEWVRRTLPMDLNTPKMIEAKIESLIIKEREQMVNFYEQGVADTSGERTDATKFANQYYELFYGKES